MCCEGGKRCVCRFRWGDENFILIPAAHLLCECNDAPLQTSISSPFEGETVCLILVGACGQKFIGRRQKQVSLHLLAENTCACAGNAARSSSVPESILMKIPHDAHAKAKGNFEQEKVVPILLCYRLQQPAPSSCWRPARLPACN